jgi:hypothetical protein
MDFRHCLTKTKRRQSSSADHKGPDCPDLLPKGLDAGCSDAGGYECCCSSGGFHSAICGEKTLALSGNPGAGRFPVTGTGGADVGLLIGGNDTGTNPCNDSLAARRYSSLFRRPAERHQLFGRWRGGDDNSVVMVRLISWWGGEQVVAAGTLLASKGEYILVVRVREMAVRLWRTSSAPEPRRLS